MMYNLNERETKILEEKCSCFSRSYHIMKDDNFYYVRRKGGILPTLVDTTLKFDGFIELSEFLEIIFSIINKKYDRIIELIDKNENIVNNIEVISFFNFLKNNLNNELKKSTTENKEKLEKLIFLVLSKSTCAAPSLKN